MKGAGWTFLLLGIALLLFAMIYDTTVDSYSLTSNGVFNLGKMQLQMMAWMAGLASFGLGAALITAGFICERAFPAIAATSEACRWCGQSVASPNTACASLDPLQWEKHRADISNPLCLKALAERNLTAGPEN